MSAQIKEQNAQELREGRALIGVFLAESTAMAGGYAAGIDVSSAAPWIAAPATAGLAFFFGRIAGRGAAAGIENPGLAKGVSRLVHAVIFSSALGLGFFSYVIASSHQGKCADFQNRVQAQTKPHL